MKIASPKILTGTAFVVLTGTLGVINVSLNSQVNKLQAEVDRFNNNNNNNNNNIPKDSNRRLLQVFEDYVHDSDGFFAKKKTDDLVDLLPEDDLTNRRSTIRARSTSSAGTSPLEETTAAVSDASAKRLMGGIRSSSRNRGLKGKCSGKGKGKGKKGKCSSPSRSQREQVIREVSCERLRDVVTDMGSKVEDLTEETFRFSSLADELQMTAYVAETGDTSRRRTLKGKKSKASKSKKSSKSSSSKSQSLSRIDRELAGDLEDSLNSLEAQRKVLVTGNGRVSALNSVLRESTIGWIGRNTDLTNDNVALSKSVNELTMENNRLAAQGNQMADQLKNLTALVNGLNEGVDAHKELNEQLDTSTAELEAQIARLESSNALYQRLNQELNDTIDDLQAQTVELGEQNTLLAGLNQDLNVTAQDLKGQVDRLEGEIEELTTQNNRLEGLVSDLESENNRLENSNNKLETHVNRLETQVSRLENTTTELQATNTNLESIASFLNETAGNLDQTYEGITTFLTDQISYYRTVATETLQNTYLQRVANWDCGYRVHFGDESFISSENLPIPDETLPLVLDYIDGRILGDVCLSRTDFENFLQEEYDDPVFTTNHFVSGVDRYALLAFDFYFPDDGEMGGLTEQDWATAGYDCTNLPSDKLFSFSSSSSRNS